MKVFHAAVFRTSQGQVFVGEVFCAALLIFKIDELSLLRDRQTVARGTFIERDSDSKLPMQGERNSFVESV